MNQTESDAADIITAQALIQQIEPILAGNKPGVQGAVIADLLATWLAGHGVEGDGAASQQLRADLVANHLQAVRQLTDIYARDLHPRCETSHRGGPQ